jgi:hypothetical protein
MNGLEKIARNYFAKRKPIPTTLDFDFQKLARHGISGETSPGQTPKSR